MGSLNRQPRGLPIGGQFAAAARDESDVLLAEPVDETAEERWVSLLGPRARAQLTRAGVTAEWLEAAEQLDSQHGLRATGDYQPLIAAKRAGFTPAQAAALFEVCGPSGYFSTAEPPWTDSDLLRSLPKGLRPIPFDMVPRLVAPGVDHAAVEVAAQHVSDGIRRSSLKMALDQALDIAAAGITQADADATGSGDDWWRAYLCRRDGVPDEDAIAWAPSYPHNIRLFQEAGWSPDQVNDDNRLMAAAWSDAGVSPAAMREWNAAGFAHRHEASRYLEAGVGPTEAAEWRAIYPTIDRDVAALKAAGVSATDAAAAHRAGLDLDPSLAPAIIAAVPPGELRQWATAFGGRIRSGTITAYRNAGVVTPSRAGAWAAAAMSSTEGTRDTITPATLGFINRHVDPPGVGGFTVAPIVTATAAELGLDPVDVQRSAERSGGGLVEGCRTVFRRRRLEPPF